MRLFIYWFSAVTMTIAMVPLTSHASTSDPRPPAPNAPEVVQVPQTLSIDVTATLPEAATGSQIVRFFRDDILIGEVVADTSRQAALTDAYNLEAGATYAYHVTYYETPDGFESYTSPSSTITIDGSGLLPPPPSHAAYGLLPQRDCGEQFNFEPGTFTALNVPVGVQVNLYRDDRIIAQGTSTLKAGVSLPGYEGQLTVQTELYWRPQRPGQAYEYRFTYIDENGVESQRSSARTVTIPHCAITDFPSLEDGELSVGVYAVRFQDWPEVPWSMADMNRYAFCSESDPSNPCPPPDEEDGPNWYIGSIPVDVDYMTRGGLAATGQVYGAADGSGFLTWPVNGADRCPGVYSCDPPNVLAKDVFEFVQSQAHIPTENYEAHVILLQGWNTLVGGFNFVADEELGNVSMMRYQKLTEYSGPDFSATGNLGVIHEAVVHGAFGYGHGGSWDCSAILDSDVGPSLEDLLAGGCTTGGGSQRAGGVLREKIGVYQPGEVVEVTASGEYEVGHWASSHAVKRLDIRLGEHASYSFEYRVPPRDYRLTWAAFEGSNGVLYAHFLPGLVSSGQSNLQESYLIKLSSGNSGGMDLGANWGDTTFDDPYRGIHVELLETSTESARVRIDFD